MLGICMFPSFISDAFTKKFQLQRKSIPNMHINYLVLSHVQIKKFTIYSQI